MKSPLTCWIFAGLAALAVRATAASFFVAPQGNDANPGTEAQPFATLERARDQIRSLKRSDASLTNMTVTVRGGTYRFRAGFVLEAQDSGSSGQPVSWRAAAGEEVRLTGSIAVAADRLQALTNDAIAPRFDEEVRTRIQRLDLGQLGLGRLAAYESKYRGAPPMPELFFNDERMTVARWPNEGWAHVSGITEGGSIYEAPAEVVPSFTYDGDRPRRWNVKEGVWLQGYWAYDWYEESIRVQSVDPETRRITLARPAHYGVKDNTVMPRRYRALNLPEELDQPGEYYIEVTTGLLYFLPPAGLPGARLELSTLQAPLIALKEVSHVSFTGFLIENTLGNGIDILGGEGIRIESCEVRNTLNLGIRVEGGRGHVVERCQVHDTGTGGIVLNGGDRRTLAPAGHAALNNHIWRFSRHQLCYASAIELRGVGNRAAHNLIHDAPHTAVYIVGNDHVFDFNIVHDVCLATDDAGALLKARDPLGRGNIIRYNLWRDIGRGPGRTAAIYFDDADGGDLVFGNIFVRAGTNREDSSFATIFSNGGHGLRADNNLFVDCERALGSSPWDYRDWSRYINGTGPTVWRTAALQGIDGTKPPYISRYPELAAVLAPDPSQPRVSQARNNVFVRSNSVSTGNWQVAAATNWFTQRDPGFVAAGKGNYQLRRDAAVFSRLPGFQPVPFQELGPRP